MHYIMHWMEYRTLVINTSQISYLNISMKVPINKHSPKSLLDTRSRSLLTSKHPYRVRSKVTPQINRVRSQMISHINRVRFQVTKQMNRVRSQVTSDKKGKVSGYLTDKQGEILGHLTDR